MKYAWNGEENIDVLSGMWFSLVIYQDICEFSLLFGGTLITFTDTGGHVY